VFNYFNHLQSLNKTNEIKVVVLNLIETSMSILVVLN